MATNSLNSLTFNDLPETGELLSTDQLIVFETENGQLVPKTYNVIDLSAVATLSGDIGDLENKVNVVKDLINNAIADLQKNYITKTDAATQYSTITNLENELKKLETRVSFTDRLKDKAESEYLDYLYSMILRNCNSVKNGLGAGHWSTNGEGGYGYKVLAVKKAGEGASE